MINRHIFTNFKFRDSCLQGVRCLTRVCYPHLHPLLCGLAVALHNRPRSGWLPNFWNWAMAVRTVPPRLRWWCFVWRKKPCTAPFGCFLVINSAFARWITNYLLSRNDHYTFFCYTRFILSDETLINWWIELTTRKSTKRRLTTLSFWCSTRPSAAACNWLGGFLPC